MIKSFILKACGIGKFVVDNTEPDWNYPHFHVLVFQEGDDDEFGAFCMELGVDAYSNESGEAAFRQVIENSLDMLSRFDNVDQLFQHLLGIAKSSAHERFWREYSVAEVQLAGTANDLGSSFMSDFTEDIKRLRKLLNAEHEQKIASLGYHRINRRTAA